MDYVIICSAALFASGLTFFSGFGLGTLLLPTFVLFFPLPAAITMTAGVHLLNNFFKLLLVGQHVVTTLKLVIAAVVSAFAGALAGRRFLHEVSMKSYGSSSQFCWCSLQWAWHRDSSESPFVFRCFTG